jgi:hypothetical protein
MEQLTGKSLPALEKHAAGAPGVRIELSDGTDLTSKIDASTAETAKKTTLGPLNEKPWSRKIEVTPQDLNEIAREISEKIRKA